MKTTEEMAAAGATSPLENAVERVKACKTQEEAREAFFDVVTQGGRFAPTDEEMAEFNRSFELGVEIPDEWTKAPGEMYPAFVESIKSMIPETATAEERAKLLGELDACFNGDEAKKIVSACDAAYYELTGARILDRRVLECGAFAFCLRELAACRDDIENALLRRSFPSGVEMLWSALKFNPTLEFAVLRTLPGASEPTKATFYWTPLRARHTALVEALRATLVDCAAYAKRRESATYGDWREALIAFDDAAPFDEAKVGRLARLVGIAAGRIRIDIEIDEANRVREAALENAFGNGGL